MHGRCVSPDTCHCEPGWGGPDCSSGESGVFGGQGVPWLWLGVGGGRAACMLATLCWPGAAQVSVDLREEASCSLCGDIGVEGSGGRRVMV